MRARPHKSYGNWQPPVALVRFGSEQLRIAYCAARMSPGYALRPGDLVPSPHSSTLSELPKQSPQGFSSTGVHT